MNIIPILNLVAKTGNSLPHFNRYRLMLFCLLGLSLPAAADFTITETDTQLTILEDGNPVLVYNHARVDPPEGVDQERYWRSSYIHPIHGINGEVVTDDFPEDHYHHRGVFWTWPEVRVGDRKMDMWHFEEARQLFQRWLTKEVAHNHVSIGVENGWFYRGETAPKVREDIHFTVHPAGDTYRAIDFTLRFTNVCDEDVVFEGAKNKGYGGFSFRPSADNKPFIFHTAQGVAEEDVLRYDTPWASISWMKDGASARSGAAMFQHPANPGFPHPGWIFRHYAFLGVCWPHEQTHTLKPGDHFELQYRLLIHHGLDSEALPELFKSYVEAAEQR